MSVKSFPGWRSSEENLPLCSFCGQGKTRKRKVVERADGLYICDDCAERVIDALSRVDIEKRLNA